MTAQKTKNTKTVKDVILEFYDELDELESNFIAKMKHLEKVFTKLKEKIERSKENPDALLKGLKNV